MEIRLIKTSDDEYRGELELRDRILRKPLGLNLYDTLGDESGYFHIVAMDADDVIGCLVLVPVDPNTIQMKQVAVDDKTQGRGIGKRLVTYAEQFAKTTGFQKMVLDSRLTALPFYERQGYRAVGEQFLTVGLPHLRMEKDL
ncbi:MAG: GNAT family N-acetyltransferase [Firmicutes bacterium]|nr:GNAT family N-acetyltransferase [Bacillota bacterium]